MAGGVRAQQVLQPLDMYTVILSCHNRQLQHRTVQAIQTLLSATPI